MIIRNIKLNPHGGRIRLRADIIWENTRQQPRELWFETGADTAEGFVCSADPFVLAGYTMASWYGETRCRIEGYPVCPMQAAAMPIVRAIWDAPRISGLFIILAKEL